MAQPSRRDYTVQEYLWEEQRSEVKRDFYNGQVYNMAGGTANHSRIAINLITALAVALRGKGCEVFNSDLKVGVSTTLKARGKKPEKEEFVTYPDLSVVCGKIEYFKDDRYTIANPTLLFEVLSPSTRNYDRSFKLEQYQKIPTLKAYIMLNSEQVKVEYYTRLEQGGWLQRTVEELEELLSLETVGIEISLKDLYERVELESDD
jgi:Uma2 family endonuclease